MYRIFPPNTTMPPSRTREKKRPKTMICLLLYVSFRSIVWPQSTQTFIKLWIHAASPCDIWCLIGRQSDKHIAFLPDSAILLHIHEMSVFEWLPLLWQYFLGVCFVVYPGTVPRQDMKSSSTLELSASIYSACLLRVLGTCDSTTFSSIEVSGKSWILFWKLNSTFLENCHPESIVVV